MISELDKIKSTITISLGTKNRLRALKSSMSYEDYINYLLRTRNRLAHGSENLIEINKYGRNKGIYNFEDYKILFSYNKYNDSSNFIFDIKIENVRKGGNLILYSEFITNISIKSVQNPLKIEYRLYFELLSTAIKNEIEPMFKHNGRFEDVYSWKEEFKLLNLPDNSLSEDVVDKLNNLISGQSVFL